MKPHVPPTMQRTAVRTRPRLEPIQPRMCRIRRNIPRSAYRRRGGCVCRSVFGDADVQDMLVGVILGQIRSLARDVVDLIYPLTCAVCSDHFHGDGPLCAECLADIRKQAEEAACPL